MKRSHLLIAGFSCTVLSTIALCQDDPLSDKANVSNPFGDVKVNDEQVIDEASMVFPPKVLGTTPMLIESYSQLDENVDKLVTIRGAMKNTKRESLIGVEIRRWKSSKEDYDAFAVGILRKFPTSKVISGPGIQSDLPGNSPTYVLYSDLKGQVSIAYPVDNHLLRSKR